MTFALPATAPMRLLVLGSCRVHLPFQALGRRGRAWYQFAYFGGEPPYTHTPAEHLQLLRILSGELVLPEALRPYVYLNPEWQTPRGFDDMMRATDAIVVELSSSNEYFAGPYALNFSRTSRMLISSAGLRSHPLMQAIAAGTPVPPQVTADALAIMQAKGIAIGDAERWLVSALWSRRIGPLDFRRFFWELRERYRKPVIAVGFAIPNESDAGQAERRRQLRADLRAARVEGVHFYDPTVLLEEIPQAELFARAGTDTAHYALNRLDHVGERLLQVVMTGAARPAAQADPDGFGSFEETLDQAVMAWLVAGQSVQELPKAWRPAAEQRRYLTVQQRLVLSTVLERVGKAEPLLHVELGFPSLPLFLAARGYRVHLVVSRPASASAVRDLAARLEGPFPGIGERLLPMVNKRLARLAAVAQELPPETVLVGPGPVTAETALDAPAHAVLLRAVRRMVVDPALLFGHIGTPEADRKMRAFLQGCGFAPPQAALPDWAPYPAWLVSRAAAD